MENRSRPCEGDWGVDLVGDVSDDEGGVCGSR